MGHIEVGTWSLLNFLESVIQRINIKSNLQGSCIKVMDKPYWDKQI